MYLRRNIPLAKRRGLRLTVNELRGEWFYDALERETEKGRIKAWDLLSAEVLTVLEPATHDMKMAANSRFGGGPAKWYTAPFRKNYKRYSQKDAPKWIWHTRPQHTWAAFQHNKQGIRRGVLQFAGHVFQTCYIYSLTYVTILDVHLLRERTFSSSYYY